MSHMSSSKPPPSSQFIEGTHRPLLNATPLVKMLAVSITEVANQFSRETAKDILDVLVNDNFNIQEFKSTIQSLDCCQEMTNSIAASCRNNCSTRKKSL